MIVVVVVSTSHALPLVVGTILYAIGDFLYFHTLLRFLQKVVLFAFFALSFRQVLHALIYLRSGKGNAFAVRPEEKLGLADPTALCVIELETVVCVLNLVTSLLVVDELLQNRLASNEGVEL